MVAGSSQTRIFGKVDGQFLHARWWLQNLILDVHTLLYFGQAKACERVVNTHTGLRILQIKCGKSEA